MGIDGLYQFLMKASRSCHLREFQGQCVAIDGHCLLRKGATGCADKLACGKQTDIYIRYCLWYVKLLLAYDIKPILVFDGRHLPAKDMTEARHRESRDFYRKAAVEFLRAGELGKAKMYFRLCVDITHEMALQLIRECRKRNVDCVVAPYEAGAQMAYLNRKGIAQAVITDNSDVMLFGCSKVLLKLDPIANVLLADAERLYLAMGCSKAEYTFDKFRYMCILSGCDYLEKLPGIDLDKARKFVLMPDNTDIRRALSKMPADLNMRHLVVLDEYTAEFMEVDAIFQYQVVFDPVTRKQVRLNEPEELGTDPLCCCKAGNFLDNKTAFQMALGNVDPVSFKQMDNWHPDKLNYDASGGETTNLTQSAVTKRPSVWRGSNEKRKTKQIKVHEERKAARRVVTNPYFDELKKESIDEVLRSYGIVRQDQQPPSKKFCLSTMEPSTMELQESTMAFEERQEHTGPSRRNPFRVKSVGPISIQQQLKGSNAVPSPLKMEENSSFLRKISPVKKIQFDSTPQTLPVTSNMEELSLVKRTVLATAGQKVMSRFFSTQLPTTAPAADGGDHDDKLLNLEHTPEARWEKTPTKQRTPLHSASPGSSAASLVKGELSMEKLDSGFVEVPQQGFSSSQKENESAQVKPKSRLSLVSKKGPSSIRPSAQDAVGVVQKTTTSEGVDGEGHPKQNVTVDPKLSTSFGRGGATGSGASSRQKKATCRRVGLSKNKGAKGVAPNQSTLFMFGFQRKVQPK